MIDARPSPLAVIVPLFVSASVAAVANSPQSVPSGIFSSVYQSPETGDLGGFEIELHPEAAAPYALVVSCEGWCNQSHRVPLKFKGRKFSFDFSEPLIDQDGRPTGADNYHVDGRATGKSVIVDLRVNDYRERIHMKRLKEPFGLQVADPPVADAK